MADQDLNIKVVTTADTTGLKQTSAELEKIKEQQEKIRQDQGAAALFAKIPPGGPPTPPAGGEPSDTVGLTRGAVGIGTIITLLTAAINKWKEFNAEQDRWVDGMIKAEEKARALGEAILDIQDKARDAARVGTEPLYDSFIRLQEVIVRLKTEQSLLNLPEQGEEWKKLAHDISIAESQLNSVTAALQRRKAEADKAAQSELEKRVPGLKAPEIKEADAQTQRILMNEQAAAKARAEGREKDAEMFQRSADQYKASATPAQLADLQKIHELQNKLKPAEGPKYQPLSPEEFQRQSEAAERALKKGGPGLIGAAAEAARRKEIQETSQQSSAAEVKRQEELRNTSEQMSVAERSRREANERLLKQQQAGTIERQTQEEKGDPELKSLNDELRKQGQKPITEAQKQTLELKTPLDDINRKFDQLLALWR